MPRRERNASSKLRFVLRALGYRNYRLFFGGQIVSLVGTWITSVASSWLVYRLSESAGRSPAMMLGLVAFASQIPLFVLSPLAGVWVDRWDKHTVLLVTQFLSMVQSFSLAVLALGGWINLWQLAALGIAQGLINAFDVPARQSFTVEMVERREDLGNAIALSSSMVHTARLVGPAIAGYLIYLAGEGVCFLIDGVSYLGVLAALGAMRLKRVDQSHAPVRAWTSLVDGVRYAYDSQPIRTFLSVVAVTSLTSMSLTTLMPLFAADILGGGERTLGMLLAASGLGAVAGSFYLASRKTVIGLGRVIVAAGSMLGVCLILFAISQSLASSLVILVAAGFGLVVQMASCNTLLQTIVDDDKRGRVMALYAMAFLGVAPLGSLLVGAVASKVGSAPTVAASGVVAVTVAIVFAWRLPKLRPLIRPIYRVKGILPPLDAVAQVEALNPTAID